MSEERAMKRGSAAAQTDLLDEIIVDNFAGGGGASTGIELAAGRPVTIAINHDPDAILMHKTNHPYTEHFQASVWDIDPREVCRGRPVGLAWFSPDCKHFSKAKGGKPVDKNIRGLAWIVLRWAGTVAPRVIILENVEEFRTWGPVRRGHPVKSKAGHTFTKWLGQLEALGYTVEWRELVAADYGAPTTRKRFFLIARRDGRPIVWPEPTHARPDSDEVRAGEKLPWRCAAEIIDWSLPTPSIFATKAEIREAFGITAQRPLAANTMRRVARGVDKFVIRAARPFIVPMGYGEAAGQAPRVHDLAEPVPTAVVKGHHGVCVPHMVLVNHAGEFRGQGLTDPIQTITAKHGYGISSPMLAPVTVTNTTNSVGGTANEPVHTVTTAGNQMLITPALAAIGQTGGGNRVRSLAEPTHTAVSKAEECLVAPALIQYHTEQTEHVRGQGVDAPIMTVDAANRYGIASAALTKYYGTDRHGQDIQGPLHTVTAKDRESLVVASMTEYHGASIGQAVDKPAPTVLAQGHQGITAALLSKFYGGAYTGEGSRPDDPLHTVTAIDHNALTTAHMAKLKGTNLGHAVDQPVQTITAGGGHFGTATTILSKAAPGTPLFNWPKVRELLNTYCGYHLADDEVILLWIGGAAYFVADIGLRMLTPRELYRANGFPVDYIIERDYMGNVYGKSKQVARCGNAVPPPFAAALVRANLPEWCGGN